MMRTKLLHGRRLVLRGRDVPAVVEPHVLVPAGRAEHLSAVHRVRVDRVNGHLPRFVFAILRGGCCSRVSSYILQKKSDFVTIGFVDLLLFVTVLPIPDSTMTITMLFGFGDLLVMIFGTFLPWSHCSHKIR